MLMLITPPLFAEDVFFFHYAEDASFRLIIFISSIDYSFRR